MTACQTLAQSLSASPSATSYPTTQFSLPPSYHHEISDLSAYNRSFPPKIKCCVDRLSWLHKADIPIGPAFVRFWSNSGQRWILARAGLSAFDPTRTRRVHCSSWKNVDGLKRGTFLASVPHIYFDPMERIVDRRGLAAAASPSRAFFERM